MYFRNSGDGLTEVYLVLSVYCPSIFVKLNNSIIWNRMLKFFLEEDPAT